MISLPVPAFLATQTQALLAELARQDMQQFRTREHTQLRAWDQTITTLKSALADWPARVHS